MAAGHGRGVLGWLVLLLAVTVVRGQAVYPASAAHPTPAWFVDVAERSGIAVRNVNGSAEQKRYILESTGSGVGIVDYDRDGWPDVFLVNGAELPAGQVMGDGSGKASQRRGDAAEPTNHLFHNNHDGTFTDVTERVGLRSGGWGQGVCVGDYDNDGWDDLYVTGYGKNRLFHNEGGKRFTEVAEAAGAAGTGKEWGTGCAFVDYDRDGRLDLVVANYVHFDLSKTPKPGAEAGCMWKGTPVMCGPRGLPSAPNVLLHNEGGGRFKDVSVASGVAKTAGHYCFSVTTIDYDEDGWPDMYVACDSTPSILYHNRRDGTFEDVGAAAGVAYNEDGREQAGMGSTAADFDGDGHIDLFKTNFSEDTSTLYRAAGEGIFTDQTFAAGLGTNSDVLGWGAMFADVDNDGRPDVLVVNGHVYPEVDSARLGSSFKERRLLYWNAGEGKFKDLSAVAGPGMTEARSGRGLATADLWNDGRVSAVVNNLSDLPMVLVNEARSGNHWVGLALRGTRSNRDGIGARVTVRGGGRSWVDEVRSGSSYNSSSDLRVHFGLGGVQTLTGITVRWPNGDTEDFAGSSADRMLELVEGAGKAAPAAGVGR